MAWSPVKHPWSGRAGTFTAPGLGRQAGIGVTAPVNGFGD
jgi:hypothetical protein